MLIEKIKVAKIYQNPEISASNAMMFLAFPYRKNILKNKELSCMKSVHFTMTIFVQRYVFDNQHQNIYFQ